MITWLHRFCPRLFPPPRKALIVYPAPGTCPEFDALIARRARKAAWILWTAGVK